MIRIQEKLIKNITIMGVALLFFGCGLNFETLEIIDEDTYSIYVTTIPDGAKLALMNAETGLIHSTFAPKRIFYTQHPHFSSYLVVSYPGYQEKTITLGPDKKEIHVVLKRYPKGKESSEALPVEKQLNLQNKNLLPFVPPQEIMNDRSNITYPSPIDSGSF